MTKDEAVELLNEFFDEFDIGAEGEAWQTLKPIVLAQQTNNNESHAICNNTMSDWYGRSCKQAGVS